MPPLLVVIFDNESARSVFATLLDYLSLQE
jgi:hypothetical protein